MEQAFDLSKLIVSLMQAVPIWGIVAFAIHFYLKRNERTNTDLEKRLGNIENKLDNMKTYFDELERRADAMDIAISLLMKDSFSSKMIANGKGGWPRIFSAYESVQKK